MNPHHRRTLQEDVNGLSEVRAVLIRSGDYPRPDRLAMLHHCVGYGVEIASYQIGRGQCL